MGTVLRGPCVPFIRVPNKIDIRVSSFQRHDPLPYVLDTIQNGLSFSGSFHRSGRRAIGFRTFPPARGKSASPL